MSRAWKGIDSDAKPRIRRCDRTFGPFTYTHVCEGRCCTGHGFTPGHAYAHWLRNYRRRIVYWATMRYQSRNVRVLAANRLLALGLSVPFAVLGSQPL